MADQTETRPERGADPEARIAAILRELTLEEKVALLAGADMWRTTPVARLGVPAIKVSDGPNGARGGGGFTGGGVSSACFPVGIALAATWDTALVERIGGALGQETRAKGARVLLAPTVNIHRSPLNGRNFECYSEDPHLSARMAVAYITGLQREGVGATVKHYACNDSEFERNTISSEVDERALREIYLPPFEAAVREAGSWAVMSGYNRVNGVYAGEHRALLRDILKDEWGFDGVVMSDWFGTKSTAAAADNGLDLEMPGPPAWRGPRLLQAVAAGEVDPAAIDAAARRVLRLIARAGAFEDPAEGPEQAIDRPEHRALIREAGAAGIVLLKNAAGVLPLDVEALSTIAIIGPNARTARIMGGGSAQVAAHYAVTPYDGLAAAVGDRVELGYELGCTNDKGLPRLDAGLVAPAAGAAAGAFAVAYHNGPDLAGEPAHRATVGSAEQLWFGDVAPGVDPRDFSARLSGIFTPREGGAHTFGLSGVGRGRLTLDGGVVVDSWEEPLPGGGFLTGERAERTAEVELVAGRPYALSLDYSRRGAAGFAQIRLGHRPPLAPDAIGRAAALAARADVALVFVGLSGDWESEGYDRPDMELVGEQNALVERVAVANPNTIVVLQTGSPVTMPWLDRVAAVVQAWYPGQECGNAIADVLLGATDAAGRLPQTFPRRLEDNPAYLNYPGENGKVRYGEGLFVGYRYYDKKRVESLFPFGFGLSYTTFAYGNARLDAAAIGPDDRLTVGVDVTNTGPRAGVEIVQLYLRDPAARLSRPEQELKGFAKVALAPGETATVTLPLDRRALAYWDDRQGAWVAEVGEFEALLGSSSRDIRARAAFRLTETALFGRAAGRRAALGVDSTVRELLADDDARAVLERHLPGFAASPQLGMAAGFALSQMAHLAPDEFPEERLRAIADDLAAFGGAAPGPGAGE